jgi:phosphocarrier protein HPr
MAQNRVYSTVLARPDHQVLTNIIMTISRNIEIINKLGLHARAAAQLVQLASGFTSHIEIEKDNRRVNGKSIMGVMMLAAGKGSEIILYTDGDDEEESMNKIEELINNRFNEDE